MDAKQVKSLAVVSVIDRHASRYVGHDSSLNQATRFDVSLDGHLVDAAKPDARADFAMHLEWTDRDSTEAAAIRTTLLGCIGKDGSWDPATLLTAITGLETAAPAEPEADDPPLAEDNQSQQTDPGAPTTNTSSPPSSEPTGG